MSIIVTCECGKRYRFKDEHAGRKTKCSCGRVFRIPERSSLPAVEPTVSVSTTPRTSKPSSQLKLALLVAGLAVLAVIIPVLSYLYLRGRPAKSRTPVASPMVSAKEAGSDQSTDMSNSSATGPRRSADRQAKPSPVVSTQAQPDTAVKKLTPRRNRQDDHVLAERQDTSTAKMVQKTEKPFSPSNQAVNLTGRTAAVRHLDLSMPTGAYNGREIFALTLGAVKKPAIIWVMKQDSEKALETSLQLNQAEITAAKKSIWRANPGMIYTTGGNAWLLLGNVSLADSKNCASLTAAAKIIGLSLTDTINISFDSKNARCFIYKGSSKKWFILRVSLHNN